MVLSVGAPSVLEEAVLSAFHISSLGAVMHNDSYNQSFTNLHLVNNFNDIFEKNHVPFSEYERILDAGWKYRSYSGKSKSKSFAADKEFGLARRWKKKDRGGSSRVD